MTTLENLLNDEYLRFLIILIGTFIFVTISYFILKLVVKRIAGRKKSYGEYCKTGSQHHTGPFTPPKRTWSKPVLSAGSKLFKGKPRTSAIDACPFQH